MSCKCNEGYGCRHGVKLEFRKPGEIIKDYYSLEVENDKLRQLIHSQAQDAAFSDISNKVLREHAADDLETIRKKEEEIDNLERAVKAQEGIIEISIEALEEALEELRGRDSEIQSIHEKYRKFEESVKLAFCSLNKELNKELNK